MIQTHATRSAEIRKKLGHPVIDGDGHFIELDPVAHQYFLDYAREIGGAKAIERFEAHGSTMSGLGNKARWYALTDAERRDTRPGKPAFWGMTGKTLDRATGYLPHLLHDRMEELGMDFAVLYPTNFSLIGGISDDELRPVATRAFNKLIAETYFPYADRITPAAIIPMVTPQEAISELEFAVRKLGFKAVMMNGVVDRPLGGSQHASPRGGAGASYQDPLAMDSPYDYDPVWAKCQELKVVVASHATGMGSRAARSPSSFVYNHMGGFRLGGDAFCRALFLGGVTRRFPNLRFAFLEGGVVWGCLLYADLISHWEKLGRQHIQDLDPKNIDVDLMLRLVDQYGDSRSRAQKDALREFFTNPGPRPKAEDRHWDEFGAPNIESAEDIRDLFVPRFYFGCEADDPTVPWAFDTKVNPLGARLQAIFSSDIGHFDVPDMAQVVEEAYELVEHGALTEGQFQEFVFLNPMRLYTDMNPDFFKGTVVEVAVAKAKGSP